MTGTETERIQTFSVSKPVTIGGRKILAASAEIVISADPKIVSALATDRPLDPSIDSVRINSVKLGVKRGRQSVDFITDRAKVSFPADAGVKAGLGIYTHYTEMLEDIAPFSGGWNRQIPFDDIPFPDIPASRYFAFYWSYGTEGSANGSIALAPGLVSDSDVHGARNRGFCVIRAYEENPPARTALRDLFGKSWVLPNQVHSVEDLQPGTWILSEVSGAFSARLGLHLGFDYNWIRSVKKDAAEVLEGDIGLKIQTGVKAAFSINADGQFMLIIGRESLDPKNRVIRVRLHRLSQKRWNVAFNASLNPAALSETLQSGRPDDFIAAILGIHGLQILDEIRRWTSPGRQTSGLAAALLVDFAQDQHGEEFERNFEKIRQTVIDWFEKWDSLPGKTASALWDIIRLDQDSIENFILWIRRLAHPETSDRALRILMEDVHFTSGPTGRWLLGMAESRIPGVITHWPEADGIRAAAQTTLDIINGKLLDVLRIFVETRVGYPAVLRAVRENNFESLVDLAKAKLAQFLGNNTPLDVEDFQKIRETIHKLTNRAEDLYRAGIEALEETFRFSIDYACSENVNQTALLDICFDFGVNPHLRPELEKAIAGNFTGVLPEPGQPALEGITIKDAVLTHRIQQQAHVGVRLPYLTSERQHRTTSLAGYEFLNENGNIYAYSLDAADELYDVARWKSILGICMSLALKERNIRRYDKDGSSSTINYRFVQAVPGLRTDQLEQFMDAISRIYFKHSFAEGSGTDKPSVHDWIMDLNRTVGRQPPNRDGLIGNSLMALNVRLPGEVLLSWLHAPQERESRAYMEMSRRFQSRLRHFIPLFYFQDPEKYTNIDAAWPLLVYASLPVTTSIKADKNSLHLNTDRDLYWNWPDERGDRRALVSSKDSADNLRQTLSGIVDILLSTPDLKRYAKYYDPATKRDTILSSVANNPGKRLMESLLFTEATIIESAMEAGRKIARLSIENVKVPETVGVLARFGSDLTQIFHTRLSTLFHPDDPASRHILKNLGLLMFSDITAALDPQFEVQPTAAFEITVLKDEQDFPPKGFPDSMKLRPDAVLARHRVLEADTATKLQTPYRYKL